MDVGVVENVFDGAGAEGLVQGGVDEVISGGGLVGDLPLLAVEGPEADGPSGLAGLKGCLGEMAEGGSDVVSALGDCREECERGKEGVSRGRLAGM